jgi:hypothetical protein
MARAAGRTTTAIVAADVVDRHAATAEAAVSVATAGSVRPALRARNDQL